MTGHPACGARSAVDICGQCSEPKREPLNGLGIMFTLTFIINGAVAVQSGIKRSKLTFPPHGGRYSQPPPSAVERLTYLTDANWQPLVRCRRRGCALMTQPPQIWQPQNAVYVSDRRARRIVGIARSEWAHGRNLPSGDSCKTI